jgi:hypothetical protein
MPLSFQDRRDLKRKAESSAFVYLAAGPEGLAGERIA